MEMKVLLTISILAVFTNAAEKVCRSKKFDSDSIVCVCDDQYCDATDPLLPARGEYLLVTSNKAGHRFASSYGEISRPDNDVHRKCMNLLYKRSAVFDVRRYEKAQTILGYGGAFTDSVGYNLNRMEPKLLDNFFISYFTKGGLNYNMGRTPIGHSDFSQSEYYLTSKVNDWNMDSFALRSEDYQLKLPHIKRAKTMVPDLLLTANIWTAPEWLKQYNDAGVKSKIIEEHWDSYCLYIMKFLEAYKEEGVEFWSVGYANEPYLTLGAILIPHEERFFTSWALNKLALFAVNHFAPALKQRGFNNTKILFFDDNRGITTPVIVQTFFNTKGISEILELIGLHSYYNDIIRPNLVDKIHEQHPNVTILTTELSSGQDGGVKLGSWATAEYYAKNYIEEMNHRSSGWIDWCLALDTKGGPSFTGFPLDAAVIVDHDRGVFYKQPSYYAIGHLSKFIPKGSVRINLVSEFSTDVQYTAALRPDGFVAVVLFNKSNYTVDVKIRDIKGDIRLNLSPDSINTVLF